MSDTIKSEVREATVIVTLNRPEKHNALSQELLRALGDKVKECNADGRCRAIVITGSDKAFSTGVDLNEALQATTQRQATAYAASFRQLGETIERSAVPVIAAVSGWCITGGMELALMCDIRLAAPNAVFGITSARIGSVAGGGGTQRLPRIVGSAYAKEMLFTSEYIDAAEAERVRLVNRVVRSGSVVDAAVAMAEKICAMAPLSISWLKSAVDHGMNMDLQSGLQYEAHLCSSAFMTEDRAEGMNAFLQKRKATFHGR
ncbi:MAG: enoyl-CoA hydratase/isomerase family protein [Rhizobiaceae bacterium]|nr:enoyl-CoA hydratase/isomerase family protein [Rhizobiaceae bacterium]